MLTCDFKIETSSIDEVHNYSITSTSTKFFWLSWKTNNYSQKQQ